MLLTSSNPRFTLQWQRHKMGFHGVFKAASPSTGSSDTLAGTGLNALHHATQTLAGGSVTGLPPHRTASEHPIISGKLSPDWEQRGRQTSSIWSLETLRSGAAIRGATTPRGVHDRPPLQHHDGGGADSAGEIT